MPRKDNSKEYYLSRIVQLQQHHVPVPFVDYEDLPRQSTLALEVIVATMDEMYERRKRISFMRLYLLHELGWDANAVTENDDALERVADENWDRICKDYDAWMTKWRSIMYVDYDSREAQR